MRESTHPLSFNLQPRPNIINLTYTKNQKTRNEDNQ